MHIDKEWYLCISSIRKYDYTDEQYTHITRYKVNKEGLFEEVKD